MPSLAAFSFALWSNASKGQPAPYNLAAPYIGASPEAPWFRMPSLISGLPCCSPGPCLACRLFIAPVDPIAHFSFERFASETERRSFPLSRGIPGAHPGSQNLAGRYLLRCPAWGFQAYEVGLVGHAADCICVANWRGPFPPEVR
jgi:hypothetical protein